MTFKPRVSKRNQSTNFKKKKETFIATKFNFLSREREKLVGR